MINRRSFLKSVMGTGAIIAAPALATQEEVVSASVPAVSRASEFDFLREIAQALESDPVSYTAALAQRMGPQGFTDIRSIDTKDGVCCVTMTDGTTYVGVDGMNWTRSA